MGHILTGLLCGIAMIPDDQYMTGLEGWTHYLSELSEGKRSSNVRRFVELFWLAGHPGVHRASSAV